VAIARRSTSEPESCVSHVAVPLRPKTWSPRFLLHFDPLTVFYVGLPARHRLYMYALAKTTSKLPSMRLKTGFQYTLVDSIATCVHAACDSHSCSQPEQFRGRRAESSHFGPRPPVLLQPEAGDYRFFVNVDPAAAGMDHFNREAGRRAPQCESLPDVLLFPSRVRATALDT
jgi:hypothetical protein